MTFITDHAGDRQIRSYYLFELYFPNPGGSPTTLRWTNCDIPVVTDTIGADPLRWSPKPTVLEGVSGKQGEVAGATLTVANADNIISAIVFAGGAQNALATAYLAQWSLTNESQIPDGTQAIFVGRITKPSLDEDAGTATLTLGPMDNPQLITIPNRKVSDLIRVTA